MTEAKLVLFLTSLFIKVSFTLLYGLEAWLHDRLDTAIVMVPICVGLLFEG